MKLRKGVFVLLAAVLLFGILPYSASAASSSEIENQIEELEKKEDALREKIDALNGLVSDNLSQMEALVAEKDLVDQQIAILHQQTQNLNDQLAAYALLIADQQDALDGANARLAELREQSRERVRAMEEDGSLSYWSVLFKANSFSDLLDRLSMMEEIAAADRRRMQELDAAAKEAENARRTLEREKQAAAGKKAALAEAQARLDEKRAETDALLSRLYGLGEEYQRFLLEKEQEMADLSEELARKQDDLEEAKREEYEQWLSTSQPTEAPGGETPPPDENGLVWLTPVKYIRCTSPYGMRIHPIHGVYMMHTGVDLAAPEGRDIWATRSGVVVTAERNEAFGNYVVINHGDGYTTLYAHMTHFIVEEGQIVGAGEKIGEVGSTGYSNGNHLHFEIRYQGQTVNPAEYIHI